MSANDPQRTYELQTFHGQHAGLMKLLWDAALLPSSCPSRFGFRQRLLIPTLLIALCGPANRSIVRDRLSGGS